MTTSVKEEVKQYEAIQNLAAKNYVETHKDSEVRRMYGHHFRSFCDGADWEHERNKKQNHELLEALKEVIEKCDGVTNPPCYIDSILFSKIKTLISKSNINEQSPQQ